MRPTDSSYDRDAATATERLLAALRRAYKVETPVTGSVIVDGREITSQEWDQMAMAWDGTADGLEALGWEEAAEAMRDEA